MATKTLRALAVLSMLTTLTVSKARAEDIDVPLSPYSARADCIAQRESGWDANAVNRRSGAAGLGQFLYGTWMTTPQGKAGMSRFDPWASHAAICFMLAANRAREFDVVRLGYC